MSNLTAIAVTILTMCMQGPVTLGACEDGSKPFEATLNIMNATTAPECPFDWRERRKCASQWDSIIELQRDKQTLFILHPDGSFETFNGFKVDEAAQVFYLSISKLLNEQVLNK